MKKDCKSLASQCQAKGAPKTVRPSCNQGKRDFGHAYVLPQNLDTRRLEDAGCLPYLRKKLDMKNQMFAGRSARRRMKYGYQCVPYGT